MMRPAWIACLTIMSCAACQSPGSASDADDARFRTSACNFSIEVPARGDPVPAALQEVLAAARRQARRLNISSIRGGLSGPITADRPRAEAVAEAFRATLRRLGYPDADIATQGVAGIDERRRPSRPLS